jgi:hypothetical protein
MSFLEFWTFSKCFSFSLRQLQRLMRFLVTMCSILVMVLLILACVCFPANIEVVDKFDQLVVSIGGNVSVVCIVALVRRPQEDVGLIWRSVCCGLDINIFRRHICERSRSSCGVSYFVIIIVNFFICLRKVGCLYLLTVEALNWMILHGSRTT